MGKLNIDGDINNLKFSESGLIPVVVQDVKTRDVLMLAYANEEAIRKTFETGYAHYWSRSRKKLWKKGETSGNVQKVISVYADCDRDAIIYVVEQNGKACHTGEWTCFHNKLWGEDL
ncbi:phosphoribosyl-AMP cyclohydrolase [Archaeoglobus sulfaticallidus PM70-1]|uniref:Phosphoribosyl-AMP cyclohydrolase n=1 Tax=Archaeoglobus sulfaticallidus PM70-1 TaxID=387631 RepID=N0BBQ2_9EURY|nr:phosphoribosyl-AMP cyclohydrolase [Archaeoglobus sulfaticallidus]AGK61014.1 phosphoribosyl-AMP cyclohydrolase [Archaeoglobus sulfaticallidus PM70-1]